MGTDVNDLVEELTGESEVVDIAERRYISEATWQRVIAETGELTPAELDARAKVGFNKIMQECGLATV